MKLENQKHIDAVLENLSTEEKILLYGIVDRIGKIMDENPALGAVAIGILGLAIYGVVNDED